MKQIQVLRLVAFALVVAIAGCGGGGGGGETGSAGAASGANGAPTASSLVPPAPTLGAVLYADASILRPMQTGAVWTYRGSAAYAGAVPVSYETTTTQTAASSSGATENFSNSSNTGAETLTVSVAGGQVRQPQSVDLTGKGTPQTINYIELRSPVRIGDQYVSLDQTFPDTAIDADGDGKPDALDVAIYSRVVGLETLTLPNLPPLHAVRVDAVEALRVKYSSTGQFSAVQTISVQTWYTAGIGIVRQTTSSFTQTDDVQTTDEQIASWDGISAGLGAMPAVPSMIPADNDVLPGQALRGGTSAAFAFPFGDHALVFTTEPTLFNTTVASSVDLRGNVRRATTLPGLLMGSWGVATADAVGVVYVEPRGAGAVTQYDLTRIDANGALVGGVRGSSLTGLGGSHISAYVTRLTAAVDGATLWVLWGRGYYDPGNGNVPGTELVLRPFGLDGTPIGPEMLVDTADGTGLALSARDGKLLLSWVQSTPGYAVMFGTASLGGSLHTQAFATGLTDSNSFVSPLQLSSGGALIWPFTLGTGAASSNAGGVLLDANMLPLRAGTTPLDEQISGLPPFDSSQPGAVAVASRIIVTATDSRKLWAGDSFSQQVDSVNWIDAGAEPLARSAVSSVRYASQGATRQAVFEDRVLVFGGPIGLTTTVVWLNKGG